MLAPQHRGLGRVGGTRHPRIQPRSPGIPLPPANTPRGEGGTRPPRGPPRGDRRGSARSGRAASGREKIRKRGVSHPAKPGDGGRGCGGSPAAGLGRGGQRGAARAARGGGSAGRCGRSAGAGGGGCALCAALRCPSARCRAEGRGERVQPPSPARPPLAAGAEGRGGAAEGRGGDEPPRRGPLSSAASRTPPTPNNGVGPHPIPSHPSHPIPGQARRPPPQEPRAGMRGGTPPRSSAR